MRISSNGKRPDASIILYILEVILANAIHDRLISKSKPIHLEMLVNLDRLTWDVSPWTSSTIINGCSLDHAWYPTGVKSWRKSIFAMKSIRFFFQVVLLPPLHKLKVTKGVVHDHLKTDLSNWKNSRPTFTNRKFQLDQNKCLAGWICFQ